jgi:hypothetical protein
LGAWGLRNYSVIGHFLTGSTHDGITLWESIYPSAREALWSGGVMETLTAERMTDDFARTQSMDEWHADAYFLARGKSYLIHHPLSVARIAPDKLFFSGTGWSVTPPAWRLRNIVMTLSSLLLLVFGTVGLMIVSRRRRQPGSSRQDAIGIVWLTILTVSSIATLAILAIGPDAYRYRVGLDGFLAIGAAALLLRWLGLDAPARTPRNTSPAPVVGHQP